MNKKLKKVLKSSFDAPPSTKKNEFLYTLPHARTTNFEFFLSQMGYIRKRFWSLSILLFIGMITLSLNLQQAKEMVGILSASLPLLTLIGITEINKSLSYNMTELEMSCKYNISKITLMRLLGIGVFHISILLLLLLLFKDQSQYNGFRYAVYSITPFLLTSYLSFWVANHIRLKDSLYICSGITSSISIVAFLMSTESTLFYSKNYTVLWSIGFIVTAVLLIKEIYFFLTERSLQWSFT